MGSRFTNNIRLYFANDLRYENEGRIGEGAYGYVFKIRDTLAQDRVSHRFALKVPFSKDRPTGEPTYISEIDTLNAFQAAAHVVNRIAITEDPLRRRVQGASQIASDWIYLEYLENGTFRQFDARLRARRVAIPNRMIWQITLCLIRMCIAMAWPDTYAKGMVRIERVEQGNYPYIISNADLHDDNIMFGDFDADGSLEHQMTPVLKMIDLGECQRQKTNDENQWKEKTTYLLDNISDQVATLIVHRAFASGQDVPLDPELSDFSVMNYKAWDIPGSAADLRTVAAGVMAAASTRTEAWYRAKYPQHNADLESDASIRALVHTLFFDADASNGTIF